jgi:predicted alpha/beta-hydrolase family hydrolase
MRWFALAVAALMLAGAVAAQPQVVTTSSGNRIQVQFDFPPGNGPFPAIVLAPGQGYHMQLPALEQTARAIVGQDIAVFRFNWAYYTLTPQGTPSADLSDEVDDFMAILLIARADPRVDKNKVSVGGKSLGSVVAWRVFSSDPTLVGALLMTPVCSRLPGGEPPPLAILDQTYPGFQRERRPVSLIVGDADPLCATSILYASAANHRGALRVNVVGGDHSFENRSLPAPVADEARRRNIDAVAALAAGFVGDASMPAHGSRVALTAEPTTVTVPCKQGDKVVGSMTRTENADRSLTYTFVGDCSSGLSAAETPR